MDRANKKNFSEECGNHNSISLHTMRFLELACRNFLGKTRTIGSFSYEDFDEIEYEKILIKNYPPFSIFWYYSFKAYARFLLSGIEDALAAVEVAEKYSQYNQEFFIRLEYLFISGLIFAAASRKEKEKKAIYLSKVERNSHLLESIALSCPQNYEHKKLLLLAEIADLKGNDVEAQYLYNKSIQVAQENLFTNHIAIACEVAAHHYNSKGLSFISKVCSNYPSQSLSMIKIFELLESAHYLTKNKINLQ